MTRLALLLGLVLSACAPKAPAPPNSKAPSPPVPEVASSSTTATSRAPAAPQPRADCVDPAEDKPPRRETDHTMTMPKTPVTIGGVTCRAEREVWVDPQKRLRACTTHRATQLFGVPIAADAYTLFHANGRPWQTTISRAMPFKVGDGKEIPCAADFLVLSEAGVLEHCKLDKSITMGNVACKAGESVAFHPGGQLWAAVTDKPYSASGVTFPAGTRLSFYASGALQEVYIREAMTIAGYPVFYDVVWFESGRLKRFTLAEDLEISGHAFPRWAKIWLREDGSLYQAEYVSERGFMVHGEPWEDTRHVRFDCAGRIVSDQETHYQAETAPHRKR